MLLKVELLDDDEELEDDGGSSDPALPVLRQVPEPDPECLFDLPSLPLLRERLTLG